MKSAEKQRDVHNGAENEPLPYGYFKVLVSGDGLSVTIEGKGRDVDILLAFLEENGITAKSIGYDSPCG